MIRLDLNRVQGFYHSKQGKQNRASMGGFTLIELLVVISIIALLIALLLPVLAKAKASAANLKCLSNERQIGVVLGMYYGENSDRFPVIVSEDPTMYMPQQGPHVLLAALFTGQKVQMSIAANGKQTFNSNFVKSGPVIMECPDQTARAGSDIWLNSHAFNSTEHWLGAAWSRRFNIVKTSTVGNGPGGQPQIISRITDIGQPGSKILADERPNHEIKYDRWGLDLTLPTTTMSGNNGIPGGGYYGIPMGNDMLTNPGFIVEQEDFMAGRHGLTNNTMYGDGHGVSNAAKNVIDEFHSRKGFTAKYGSYNGQAYKGSLPVPYPWNLYAMEKFK